MYHGLVKGMGLGIMCVMLTSAFASKASVMNLDKQQAKTPQLVLERLKEGNQRFVAGKSKNRDLLAQAKITASGQYPVAVILNCMDARTPTEMIFDQGIGDIFAIRIAGNIQNNDILGSMEFGTKLAGAKLIVVMGHTSCGAIRGACQQAKLGNLTQLLEKIQPAIIKTTKGTPLNCKNPKVIDDIAKNNVLSVIKQIPMHSPVIAKMITEGEIGIIGGIQDLTTGKVTFFEDAAIFPKKAYVQLKSAPVE